MIFEQEGYRPTWHPTSAAQALSSGSHGWGQHLQCFGIGVHISCQVTADMHNSRQHGLRAPEDAIRRNVLFI